MGGLLPDTYGNTLLRSILSLVTSGGFDMVLEVLKVVKRQLSREWHEGMYEILEYDCVLELNDDRGEAAVLRRRQKVRFLQDNIIAYEDQAWGEGQIFADYQCSPGVPVDFYQDGFKWKVLISLRENKNRGDVTEFHLQRTIAAGFTNTTEWFQTELDHRTHHIRISVVFPRHRPCQQALLVERNRNKTTELASAAFSWLADGRQSVSWETNRPGINELYTLKWRW